MVSARSINKHVWFAHTRTQRATGCCRTVRRSHVMSEKVPERKKKKRKWAKRCVLPDYDIHDQHVSNQPHHAHDGVESGDDNRYDDGVGVAVRAAAQATIGAASHVGEARAVVAVVGEVAEAAAVVQRGELAPVVRVRAVACALHGPRCAESGRWEDTAAAEAAAAVRVSPASATVVPPLGLRVCARSVRPVLSVSVLKNAAARDAPRVLTNSV